MVFHGHHEDTTGKKVKHRVRFVYLWKQKKADKLRKVLVTNRTRWEVSRVLRQYRHRWTGTETFHRDGKQQLGMGDCQLRNGKGQTRHMYLVFLAYSLLMRQLRSNRSQEWALTRLTTIGEACRAMTRETLGQTIRWTLEQVTDNQRDPQKVLHQLGLA